MADDNDFWAALEQLTSRARLIIDRPKGSQHPRYPALTYPLDYGYFEGTTAGDGHEIDVWRGSLTDNRIVGIISTVDLMKNDAEVKILVGCTTDEIAIVQAFYNEGSYMKGILTVR
jgi:inorganic pyrophosphatase